MLLPRAEFWRLWGCFVAAFILLVVGFTAIQNAHGETMRSSFYGAESGTHNADGSRFNPMGLTAAHRSLRFGTQLRVCLVRCVVVTVRDRGPARWTGRDLDLSRGAARAIGLEPRGVANITVDRLN